MEIKNVVAVVLIVAGAMFGFIGYQKSQPTMMENIASGIVGFAATMNADPESPEMKKISDIEWRQLKRGLPYYVIAGIAVAGGLVLLITGNRKEPQGGDHASE
jgi:TctA family transporter